MLYWTSGFSSGPRQLEQDAYWREDDGGPHRNVEQLIWAGLVALLVHLIATLQWPVEPIPQAKCSNIIEYLRLVTDLH